MKQNSGAVEQSIKAIKSSDVQWFVLLNGNQKSVFMTALFLTLLSIIYFTVPVPVYCSFMFQF